MSEPSDNPVRDGAGALPRCPICGKASVVQFRPFCSRRCADIDLSRWLTGAYAIASGGDDDDEDGDGAAAAIPRRSAEERE